MEEKLRSLKEAAMDANRLAKLKDVQTAHRNTCRTTGITSCTAKVDPKLTNSQLKIPLVWY